MAVKTTSFVQAKNFTRGRSNAIDVLVIHTMESPEKPDTAESVAHWFAGSTAPQASAHYCIDDNTVVQCVHDGDVAWHAPGANHNGLGFEHAGRAAQSKHDWSDDYSAKMLDLSAQLVAEKCAEHHIPVVWLQPADLRAGRRGITGHVQVSDAFKRTDHRDPGGQFPVEAYLALVRDKMGEAHVPADVHRGRDKAPEQNPTLEEGSEGYQVKRLQRLLADHHFDPGVVDGIFGPATKKAVVKAQTTHGLNANGIASAMTWHALLASETKT
jgi:N-acetyl-anhydromuramyl-L-alanine amidase AmpD